MRLSLSGWCAASVLCIYGSLATVAPKPNIMHILLDDFGWADAGWHRPAGYVDVQSPNMVALVKEGVELDRHYVFMYCSPSRSAMQSGRNPIQHLPHAQVSLTELLVGSVNTVNAAPNFRNPADPVSGYAGMPRNMTGIGEHMLRAGYRTHAYGKWDAGMGTPEHTPQGRGYQKSLVYFHHVNDAWNMVAYQAQCGGKDVIDLWEGDKPAVGVNNSHDCSQENQHSGCVYEDQIFTDRVIAAIKDTKENATAPFFIFWSPRIVHSPLQVPQRYLDHFAFIPDKARQIYHAMVYFIDEAIGNVTQLLKTEALWNNTLVVVQADKNNYPLKGGKMSNWEGGIRANAFATGGFLPRHVRGTKQDGLIGISDWYSTYAALAGVDPTDYKAQAAKLPPIDSYNMWPLLSGHAQQSPRTELAIGAEDQLGGLIRNGYKLLLGTNAQAGWTGPQFPNMSSHWDPNQSREICGDTAETGCLFNIMADPGEHLNLATSIPALFEEMLKRAMEINATVFAPDRGHADPDACRMAMEKYGGFWGPWVDV